MRTPLLTALAALSLTALPAQAKEPAASKEGKKDKGSCHITVKKGDLVAQGKTLVIQGQQETHDALVIDGDAVVRAGAKVNDVVALRGKVTVEAGAWVAGDVTALGGDVIVQKDAHVTGDVNAIGGQLRVAEGASLAGDKNQLSVNINGEEFFQGLLTRFVTGDGTRDCKLSFKED